MGTARARALPVLGAAVLALSTACGGPDLLDPTDDALAADRDLLIADVDAGFTAVLDQLGAGEVLATRVDTGCTGGTSNWKIHDTYRSVCRLTFTMAAPLDTDPARALGGLDGMEGFEATLDDAGWGSADWSVVGNAPGVGVDVAWLRENGRTVADVEGVRLYSGRGDGTSLWIGFDPSSEPVPAPNPGTVDAGYYADTEGADWQDAWAEVRDDHPYLVAGYASAVLAEQPW